MTDLKIVIEGPEKDCCITCEFCSMGETDPNTLQKQAICRRYPPVGYPLPANGGVAVMTIFPPVTKEMICFEFHRMREIL